LEAKSGPQRQQTMVEQAEEGQEPILKMYGFPTDRGKQFGIGWAVEGVQWFFGVQRRSSC